MSTDYQIIFENYIEARVRSLGKHARGSIFSGIRKFNRVYLTTAPLIWCYDRLNSGRHTGDCGILFVGSKVFDLVGAAASSFSVGILAKGVRSRREARRHGKPYFNVDSEIYRLYRAVLSAEGKERESAVSAVVDRLARRLEMMRPRVVVMFSNTSFFERALVLAANRSGIPTVKVQHGMMHHDEDDAREANISDYIFVWGEYFRSFLMKTAGITESRIKVLGYPFLIPSASEAKRDFKNGREMRMCFIGQNNRGPANDYIERKFEVLRVLSEVGRDLGIRLFYRPHPTEFKRVNRWILDEVRLILGEGSVTPSGESINDAAEKYGVFFSFYSTALTEMALRGRWACQVMGDWGWEADDFQELGVCARLGANREALHAFVNRAMSEGSPPAEVDRNYISVPDCLSTKFARLINDVIATGPVSND